MNGDVGVPVGSCWGSTKIFGSSLMLGTVVGPPIVALAEVGATMLGLYVGLMVKLTNIVGACV